MHKVYSIMAQSSLVSAVLDPAASPQIADKIQLNNRKCHRNTVAIAKA